MEKNDKIVYIFGDIHYNLNNQTQCKYDENIETIDIEKFFIKLFKKNKNKKYNFFYESYIDIDVKSNNKEFKDYNNYYKKKYFDEINKLAFNNTKIENNKIHISTYFPNVRFYFFNIRSSIKLCQYYWFNIRNKFYDININFNIHYIINLIKETTSFLDELIIYLNSNENEYINKLLNKYQDNKIKIIINNLYKKYIIHNFTELKRLCDETNNYINSINFIDFNYFNTIEIKYKKKYQL